jgi:hypothetical protein
MKRGVVHLILYKDITMKNIKITAELLSRQGVGF